MSYKKFWMLKYNKHTNTLASIFRTFVCFIIENVKTSIHFLLLSYFLYKKLKYAIIYL